MRFYAFSLYDRYNHVGVSIGPSLVYGISIFVRNAQKRSKMVDCSLRGLGAPIAHVSTFLRGLGAPITLRVYHVAYMHSCEPCDFTHLV